MKRLRYLNPFLIRRAVREIRRVMGNGGPKLIRLVEVGHPEGWFLPTTTVVLEVKGQDNRIERFTPAFPIPWPAAWGYRIARRLGVPLIRDVSPEKFGFEMRVPGR